MSDVKNEIATYFGRCKCCLSYGYLKNMWTEHQFEGESEVYGEMLVECFALTWDSSEESIEHDQICEQCVNRLRDACDFKKIVLTSQEDFFRDMGDDKDSIPKLEDCEEQYLMVYKGAESDTADTADTDTADMDISVHEASVIDEEYEDVEYLEDEVGGDKEALGESSSMQAQKPKRRRKAETQTDSDDGVKRKWPKRLPKNERFKTYKQYTEENLRQCLEAVRSGNITPNDAARKYNIPKKTICAKMRLEPTDVQTDNTTKTTNTLETNKKTLRRTLFKKPPVDAKTKLAVEKRKLKAKNIKKNVKTEKDNKVTVEVNIQPKDEENTPVNADQVRTRYRAIVDEIFKTGNPETEKSDVNEILKHKDNVKTILRNTNATVIKGYWGVGYYCAFCDEQTEAPSELKKHNLDKHSNEEDVIQVKYVSDLVIRVDITDLKCSVCDKEIDTLEDVKEHLKTVHDKVIHTDIKNHIIPFKFDSDVLKCVMCKKEYKFFKLLSEHMSEHYRNYECNVCERGFINKQSMQTHTYRHKRGVFKCANCPKVFDCRPKRSAHERIVHTMSNKTRKCAFCDERFSTKDLVKNHEVKAHGVKPTVFSCTACNKSYTSQSSLITHRNRFHLMLRPHKCSYCEMAFFSKIELKSHIVTHTKTRDFKCDMCSKSFGTKCSLNQHVRGHLDDRRYKCENCERAFVHRTAWKVHMRSKHARIV